MKDVTGCRSLRPSPLHCSALAPGKHGMRFSGKFASKPLKSKKNWAMRPVNVKRWTGTCGWDQNSDLAMLRNIIKWMTIPAYEKNNFLCHTLSVVHLLPKKCVLKMCKGSGYTAYQITCIKMFKFKLIAPSGTAYFEPSQRQRTWFSIGFKQDVTFIQQPRQKI